MIFPQIRDAYHFANDWIHSHPLVQSLISGLSLSTLITLGLALVKSRADRLERTFKLHNEFASYEFIKARDKAYVLLAKNPTLTFVDLEGDEKFEEQFIYLTRVVTFYEHLSISIRSGFIDKKAGCRYFGMVFIWWNHNYFATPRGLASTEWEAKKDLEALFEYFKKYAKREDWDAWMMNAQKGSSIGNALKDMGEEVVAQLSPEDLYDVD